MLTLSYYVPLAFNLARILLILFFAYVGTRLVGRLLRGLRGYIITMMLKAGGGSGMEIEKRVKTVSGVARKALFLLVWSLACIMALKGVELRRCAAAGRRGRGGGGDWIRRAEHRQGHSFGSFPVGGESVRVNDVALINGKGGLVEEINLRTIVLRGEDGAVHIFPNGSIQAITNLTREYSYYLFNVAVAYKTNPDDAIQVLKETAEQLMAEEPYHSVILAPLEVMGVDQLGDFSVIIKARFKTQPIKQWLVGREMNRRIKMRFQEAGIEIPFPTQTLHFLPGIPPELRGELKNMVREVIEE